MDRLGAKIVGLAAQSGDSMGHAGRSRFVWSGALLALAAALGASCMRSPAPSAGGLVSSSQLRQFSPDNIRSGAPVRLEGVITYFDRLSSYCFVQDAGGGVRVELVPGQIPPANGWHVQVSGQAASGGAAPSIVGARLTAVKAGDLSPPPAVSGQRLREAGNQYRRVAVTGVVRSVSTERAGLIALEIQAQGVTVWAKVPGSQLDLGDAAADAEIRVEGVLADDGGASTTLWAADTRAISITRPAANPDSLPLTKIAALLGRDASHLPLHRVRVRGVSRRFGNQDLALKDETGELAVRLADPGIRTNAGELDLAGFLDLERGGPVLAYAVPAGKNQSETAGRSAADAAALATVLQVRQLQFAVARLGRPVHLHAVVTYFDAVNELLFVQDATDGVFVELMDNQQLTVKAGDAVDLTGVTTADFAPNVGKARLKVVGHPGLPEPKVRSLGVAIMGNEDSHWISLPGVVQHVAQERADSLLTLVWGRESYKAHVLGPSGPLASLVGAEVRVRGVCGSLFNGKRQLLGIQLFVPGAEFIEVTRRADADPFASPPVPVKDLMRFSAAHNAGRPVRLHGVVTYADRDGVVWIRDATGGVMLQDLNPQRVVPGDLVDAVGFPAIAGFSPVLRGAQLRRLASGTPPAPVRITAEDALKGDVDGQLVQLEGKLIDQLRQPADHRLAIQAGGTIFNADLPGSVAAAVLEPGMLLRLTGICAVAVEQSHDLILPRGFRILLRSPADVVVLKRPPLWTPQRMAPVVGSATLVMLAALIWAAFLRQRIGRQTHALRTQTVQLQTAHQRTRDALRKVSDAESLHRESNGILELIARDAPVSAIADRIAEAVALHAEESVCTVLLADHHKLRVFAVPALPSGWLETLRQLDIGSISFSGEFREPKQFSGDPLWEEFSVSQTGARFRTFYAAPIVVDGVTAGAIATFFRSDRPAVDIPGLQVASWCNMAALALERRKLHDQLSYRAQHDRLTGLPNRDLLYERLEQEIARASGGEGLLGLLYIDLDGFKDVNDAYGHDAGDAVLQHAARRMTRCVRRGDTVARIGGDEFVVLLPRLTRKSDAESIAAKLVASLREPVYAARQELTVSASVGIAIWPIDGDQPDHLLRFADAQMYGHKRRRWYESRPQSPAQPGAPAESSEITK